MIADKHIIISNQYCIKIKSVEALLCHFNINKLMCNNIPCPDKNTPLA